MAGGLRYYIHESDDKEQLVEGDLHGALYPDISPWRIRWTGNHMYSVQHCTLHVGLVFWICEASQ